MNKYTQVTIDVLMPPQKRTFVKIVETQDEELAIAKLRELLPNKGETVTTIHIEHHDTPPEAFGPDPRHTPLARMSIRENVFTATFEEMCRLYIAQAWYDRDALIAGGLPLSDPLRNEKIIQFVRSELQALGLPTEPC